MTDHCMSCGCEFPTYGSRYSHRCIGLHPEEQDSLEWLEKKARLGRYRARDVPPSALSAFVDAAWLPGRGIGFGDKIAEGIAAALNVMNDSHACEDGMCWAESLGEACDHWKAETERLRATAGTYRRSSEEREAIIQRHVTEIGRLREALRTAISWSYGEAVTPEERDAVERILDE